MTTGPPELNAGGEPRVIAMDNFDENTRDSAAVARHDSRADTTPPPPDRPRNDRVEHQRRDGDVPAKNKQPWYRRPLLVGILMLVVIMVAVGGALWWRH